jgi:hypothetical protein
MYAKFAAAIVCLVLCSLNVVAFVKRTPIRTTLEGSTRTTVEMMPSPNSPVHWMSAVIFIAGFACFLSWGISDYNNAVETEETLDEKRNLPNANVQGDTNLQHSQVMRTRSDSCGVSNVGSSYPGSLAAKNVVEFSPRPVFNPGLENSNAQAQNQSETLSKEEFYSQLQDEDYWEDDSQVHKNHSAS